MTARTERLPSSVAIAVVAKAPVAGQVKTRMQPTLSAHQAADLATATLIDVTAAATTADAGDCGRDVWWSYAGNVAVIERLRPPGVRLLAQVGNGLGARLAHAHQTLHERGYDRVVLVGADCPTVDADALRCAVRALDRHDVVIGLADDGGYTLLGTSTVAPTIFSEVPMSTAHTAASTVAEARRLGLDVAVTTTRPDLDTVDDLRAAQRGGWLDHAPRTAAAVVALLGADVR